MANTAKIVFTISLSLLLLQGYHCKESVSHESDSNSIEDDSNSTRIIGGSIAKLGQFPYQAALYLDDQSFACSGSIIGSNWVLTVARCLYNQNVASVRVGSLLLNSGGAVYNVASKFIHQTYDYATSTDNIGLIKTTTPIAFNKHVKSIALPLWNSGAGKNGQLSGWGHTSHPSGSLAPQLQHLTTTTISNDMCAWAFPNDVRSTTLCTYKSVGKGACIGDLGDPLVCEKQLYGILSVIRPCANGFPDIFTRVYLYNTWIQNTMAAN